MVNEIKKSRQQRRIERQAYIADVLKRGTILRYRISQIARVLECSRTTVYKDLAELNIKRQERLTNKEEGLQKLTEEAHQEEFKKIVSDFDSFVNELRHYLTLISKHSRSQKRALRAIKILMKLKDMELNWRLRFNLIELYQKGLIIRKKKPRIRKSGIIKDFDNFGE